MPLLVCPNDNAAMQSVARSGVEFDFCPTCRGIWLDRGELEKLLAAARDQEGPQDQEERGRPAEPAGYARPERSAGDRRWDDDDHRNRRRRGFDIFDIFD
ncbi:MAG: zf-TFIIB domain-containing protein [Alphaproteobacteria bacterium]